jgi:hypothetical protein
MYNSDTELIFPSRLITGLNDLRGDKWQHLVVSISQNCPDSIECTAFILMMARLTGCISCNADSYRGMRGCNQCARQSIRRFRGTDQELADQYQKAFLEVKVKWELLPRP